ncbi:MULTISPECIES: uracil-DNA glycosylase family protein [unclassified Cryobacterium]|uniref:uracil-DNA glycosylase family protein n=1 Tax=unclassified Cryobacterium TaxID=2649013 RepID=UPI0018E09BAA|nr:MULTISPECIES: uracil-DNA glycosylase family protein [unclassified Cryobacterium]
MTLDEIRQAIDTDPSNAAWAKRGVGALFVADPAARIVIIGQAPGQKAEASGIPWDDASGAKLMLWLGVTEDQFRDPALFATSRWTSTTRAKEPAATCRHEKTLHRGGIRSSSASCLGFV